MAVFAVVEVEELGLGLRSEDAAASAEAVTVDAAVDADRLD